jgi:hypothetical protein
MYTANTIADFLQWGTDKVKDALSALELIEQGLLTEDHFKGLGPAKAKALTTETRYSWSSRQDAQ